MRGGTAEGVGLASAL